MSAVPEIKSKLDIVAHIGRTVKLERLGASWKGKCPFHHEKTASFFVSPERQAYYCFGCGAKGDIVSFVEQSEGLDFRGALKLLAEEAGVELEKFSGGRGEPDDKGKLFSLSEQAAFYFEKNLSEHAEAQRYLEGRGLKKETIRDFRLGFALGEWRSLFEFLVSKGAETADIERAGLAKKSDSGNPYDTFRSRIMFPLLDASGRVVAFSGRMLGNDPNAPKYLNSPETPIFKKSEVLFGLDKAKAEIRRLDYSIIVEGQMDLVMMHQAGLKNTVASSGTALTETHLRRLSRLSPRAVLAFDGDAAGMKAMMRAAAIGLALGMEIKAAEMPEGLDPADLALRDPAKLLDVFRRSVHVISFALEAALKAERDPRKLARKVVAEVLPLVALLPLASEEHHFVQEISRRTGIKEDALSKDLSAYKTARPSVETHIPEETAVPLVKLDRFERIIQELAAVANWKKETEAGEAARARLREYVPEYTEAALASIADVGFVFRLEAEYTDESALHAYVIRLEDSLHEEILRKKFAEAEVALRRAEVQKDESETKRLLAVCADISKQLNALKQK